MNFRIPKKWIYEYSEDLLREAGVDKEEIDADLDNFIYKAGEREWEEYDKDGSMFYFVTCDDEEYDY